MTGQPSATTPRPPIPRPPQLGAHTPASSDNDDLPVAGSPDQVHAALGLDLGANVDLTCVIETLTLAHQALNIRLTDTH